MGKKCIVCNKKSQGVALHSFPKDVDECRIWKQICNLEEYDDVSRCFICSKHFLATDYIEPNARGLGGRLRLKPGKRYPSRHVPHKLVGYGGSESECATSNNQIQERFHAVFITSTIEQETVSSTSTNPLQENYPSITTAPMIKEEPASPISTNIIEEHSPSIMISPTIKEEPVPFTLTNQLPVNSTSMFISPTIQHCQEPESSIPSDQLQEECSCNSISITPPIQPEAESYTSTNNVPEHFISISVSPTSEQEQEESEFPKPEKQRRFLDPRFAGEIMLSDFATPKGAKRAFFLLKNRLEKEKMRSKALAQKNIRLRKKVDELKGIIEQLKEESSNSEDVTSTAKKRKLKNKKKDIISDK